MAFDSGDAVERIPSVGAVPCNIVAQVVMCDGPGLDTPCGALFCVAANSRVVGRAGAGFEGVVCELRRFTSSKGSTGCVFLVGRGGIVCDSRVWRSE